jgi:hypothetical protein
MEDLIFLYTSTNTRVNDKWYLTDELATIVNRWPADLKYKNFVDIYDQIDQKQCQYQLLRQSFLQVVTETAYHYPLVSWTEKTFKPFVSKRPFVALGTQGLIKHLHFLGFKTFSRWWSEDYDQIEDPEKRLLAVVDIVEWLCKKSILELHDICNSMQDVLNYNHDYYFSKFTQVQEDNFERACIKNLNRYDSN